MLFFLTGRLIVGWTTCSTPYGDSIDRVFDDRPMGPAALTDDRPRLDARRRRWHARRSSQVFVMSSRSAKRDVAGSTTAFSRHAADAPRFTVPERAGRHARNRRRDRHSDAADRRLLRQPAPSTGIYNGALALPTRRWRACFNLLRKGSSVRRCTVVIGDRGDALDSSAHRAHAYRDHEDIRIAGYYSDSSARSSKRGLRHAIHVAPRRRLYLALLPTGGAVSRCFG